MILRHYLHCFFAIICLSLTIDGISQINPPTRNFAAAETDVHYQEMHVEIDPAINKVAGEITYYFTSRLDQLNRFVVDYQDDLAINYILRGNTPLLHSRSDDLVTIDLGKSLMIGEQDTLTISFESEGTLRQELHNGIPVISTDLELDMLWYPGKRDLTDKIDSVDVYVTTPPDQYAVGNGTLEGIEEVNGKWIHHWQHRYPVATTYLLHLAISNYTLVKDSVQLQDGTELPIYHYLYPESVAALSPELAATPDIMQFFESRFGAYPFADEKYGHAQYTAGGALEVQTIPFMGFFNFEVIAHEMAHQWFGNNVTFGSWTDIWLSEGMAEYLSGLAVEALRPAAWNGVKTSKINSITSQPGGSVYVTDTTDLSVIFDGRLTYDKGFYLAHMLRWVVGDSAFFEACRNYLEEHDAGFARTHDFQDHLEAVSGKTLDGFFEDWFYGEGYPSYTVTWEQQQDSVILWIDQVQSDPSVSYFEMPLPIAAYRFGIVADTVFQHTYEHQRFAMYVGMNPISQILFDQEKWILSKGNKIIKLITAVPKLDIDSLVIYPNPASHFIELSDDGSVAEIEFIHASGIRISRVVVDRRVSLEGLISGQYTLVMRDRNKVIVGRRSLIVQK
ncbi:MAG TPA: M1 family metallopeptidase [Saprospiraceae bacterium]